jgi:N-acetylglucosaminyl-diphospho-decaprenol L-rhamnosyltransferase
VTGPDLSVVIVSHNHAHYLGPCLDSVGWERARMDLEGFVVDNASTDATVALVRERYPWVHSLCQARPQGFSANNNAAIRRSAGRYVLLLNPDTVVEAGALAALVRFMDAHPRVGICGAQLVFPDGSIQPSCRRFPTLASVVARRTPLRVFLRRSALNARHLMADFDHTRTAPVDWMLGACLMARREVLQQVGLLDEGYYLYTEDIDWCYRARRAGWEVMYVAEARIVHDHQARSDRKLLSRHSWIHLQSMWRYYRKHLAPGVLRLRVTGERLD